MSEMIADFLQRQALCQKMRGTSVAQPVARDGVGQPGTSETGAAIKRASDAAILRWSPPGVMLTMDYREDRVTVWLDSSKIVTKIRCG